MRSGAAAADHQSIAFWQPILAPAVVLAIVARIIDGLTRPIDYNGFWHVLIARNLPREWRNLPHPPLFLLFLRGADALSHSVLSYRSISFLTGVLAVYLVGWILLRLGTLPVIAALGATTMALACNPIMLSNEVQSYSLCVLFVLVAFAFYLNLTVPEPLPSLRARAGFAGFSCLALLSHYLAGLFLIACVMAPLAVVLLDPSSRRAAGTVWRRRWRADLLTLLIPAIVGLLLYEIQAKRFVQPLNELPGFYLESASETVSTFLVRNLKNTVNLFAPLPLFRARLALPVLVVFVLVVVGAAIADRRRSRSALLLLPSLFLVTLLLLGMILGVLGKYPFGGWMRQQFLLFLFGLLAGFVALDRLARTSIVTRHRALFFALCGCVLALNAVLCARKLVQPTHERFIATMKSFDENFPSASVIHVDQFSLIGFFLTHHDWDWRFLGRPAANSLIGRYAVQRNGRRLTLVAHRGWWLFDPTNPALYAEVASAWGDDAPAGCALLFRVSETFYKPIHRTLRESDRASLEDRIRALAAAEGLPARRIVLTPETDLSADLCPEAAPAITRLVPPGTAVGTPFQVQQRGDSALSIIGKGFRRGAVVVLAGRELETAFGNSTWITASVPASLYSQPGNMRLVVRNPDLRESNAVYFDVHR